MRKLIALILAAHAAALSPFYGATTIINSYRFVAGGGGGTLLLDENFEGTGTPTGWTVVTGSPNFDNTSSPLTAAQDLLMSASGQDVLTKTWTSATELWMTFTFSHVSGLASAASGFYVTQNTNGSGAYIGINFSGSATPTVKIDQNGTTVGTATVGTLTAATKYYFRLHVLAGSGANAAYDIEFNTSNSFTGSGNNFTNYTSGTITTGFQVGEVYRSGNWSGNFHADDMKVSNTGWPP